MSLPRIKPWFSEETYKAIKDLIPDEDLNLPPSYGEWLTLAKEEEFRHSQAEGLRKVSINVDQYVAWCRSAGLACNYVTVCAFSVREAHTDE